MGSADVWGGNSPADEQPACGSVAGAGLACAQTLFMI